MNRIAGIETEYGCLSLLPPGSSSAVERVRDWIFSHRRLGLIDVHHRDWDEPSGNGGFLFNGGRLYIDMGHLEYCTPECLSLLDLLRYTFTNLVQTDFTVQGVHTRALGLSLVVMKVLAPFTLGLAAIAALSCLAQVGPLLTWKPLQPQFSRLNPLSGFQRLFSLNALVDLFKSVLKITLVGSVAWVAFQGQVTTLPALSDMTPLEAIRAVGDAVYQIVWRVVMVFGGLALVDYFYQRYSYEKSLKMSKEDIKEEFKQSEGDPQIRARLRQRARALSRQRMMKQVPQADVVVKIGRAHV